MLARNVADCEVLMDLEVTLGFLEKQEDATSLLRHNLPSKVGGQPAWLHSQNIPGRDRLTCGRCESPLRFLLQLYCPLPNSPQHRMLYLFACASVDCLTASSVVVVRAQSSSAPVQSECIPDEILSTTEPEEPAWLPDPSLLDGTRLCALCGIKGTHVCSGCRRVSYCCKAHQSSHWTAIHAKTCRSGDVDAEVEALPRLLFPQYEIVTELEDPQAVAEGDVKEIFGKLKTYEKKRKTSRSGAESDDDGSEGEEEDPLSKDECLARFYAVMRANPDQVIRYSRGNLDTVAVWLGSANRFPGTGEVDGSGRKCPEKQKRKNSVAGKCESLPPRCELCGGERVFEFQILPQLLHYLGVDGWNPFRQCSMDWATLTVFTCERSCSMDGYTPEFVYVQPPPDNI